MPDSASPADNRSTQDASPRSPELRLHVGILGGMPPPPDRATATRRWFKGQPDEVVERVAAAGRGDESRDAALELVRRKRVCERDAAVMEDVPASPPPATARERLAILRGFGLDVADFLVTLRVAREASAAAPVPVKREGGPTLETSPPPTSPPPPTQ
jgi:hypothetical protein